MPKNEIDYNQLGQKILKTSYRLSDVQHRLEKVGFDIVRFKDDDVAARLWQVQSTGDGDYIVALYQVDGEDGKVAESSWNVTLNKLAKTLSFHYKGEPITKIAASKLGIPEDEVESAVGYLPEKLASNKKLAGALLKELSVESRNAILTKHPELKV